MRQAIGRALARSPAALAARDEMEAALANAEQDRPSGGPSATVSAGAGVQTPRYLLPGASSDHAALPLAVGSAGLTVEQPLYRAGRSAARARYAAEVRAARLNFRAAQEDLALQVWKAYAGLLNTESGVREAETALGGARQYEALAQAEVQAGSGRPVDALIASGQTAAAESRLATAQDGAESSQMELRHLMGDGLDAPVAPAAPMPALQLPASLQEAISTALRSRPEVQLLEDQLASARSALSLASAQFSPELSLRGELTEQTPSALRPEHYASAFVELSWPLSDRRLLHARQAAARAEEERARQLLLDSRSGVELDVRRSWNALAVARRQVELAAKQLTAARAGQLVAETAYRVGRGTSAAVSQASDEAARAADAENQAKYVVSAAIGELLHAEGVLVEEAGAP